MWAAHLLTLSRVPLAGLFWVTATRMPWALVVLALAGATDLADGWFARRARRRGASGRWAQAGAWLDPCCDKLFAITVLAALAVYREVAAPLLLLIGARELVLVPAIAGYAVTPLRRRFRPAFRSGPVGKRATIAQFVAVVAILLELPGVWGFAVVAGAFGVHAALWYLRRAAAELRDSRARDPERFTRRAEPRPAGTSRGSR